MIQKSTYTFGNRPMKPFVKISNELLQLKGRLVKIGEIERATNQNGKPFDLLDFVIEYEEPFGSPIHFTCFDDDTIKLLMDTDLMSIVQVYFNIYSIAPDKGYMYHTRLKARKVLIISK